MSRLSSLLGRVKDKRNELVRRAASKAADVALERTKDVARGALDSVSDTIEKAIFGDVLEKSGEEGEEVARTKASKSASDPFAKLKEREREQAKAPTAPDDDVDAELAALKKRLSK